MMKVIFNKKTKELHKELLIFFNDVIKQYKICVEAIENSKLELFDKVFKKELKINRNYYRIFKKIVYLLAIFNTYGADLRNLLSFAFIVNEIERIGDYAKGIAQFYQIEKKVLSESKILTPLWKELIKQLEKVEKILEKTNLTEIEKALKDGEKFNINEILKYSEKFSNKKTNLKSNQDNYYFFLQFKFLTRAHERLSNILEYLLFKKSFFAFRDYQKNR